MTTTDYSQSQIQPAAQRTRFWPKPQVIRDNFTAYLFIFPAVLLIFIFGIFPIGYAAYMSLHIWRIRRGDFLCERNFEGEFIFGQSDIIQYVRGCLGHYEKFIGDWGGLAITIVGFAVLLGAYLFWTDAFKKNRRQMLTLRLIGMLLLLALGVTLVGTGWSTMLSDMTRRDRIFLDGLQITVYYAIGSVPVQLGLGLALAYVLFKPFRGRDAYRMAFFIPYVVPQIASALMFGTIFSARTTSWINQFLQSIGLDPLRWISEPRPFLEVVFGLSLPGFLAGPSLSMVTVIVLGWWTFTGYNAVIFMAGLGNIPADLYEAARVDGASEWQMFRSITLPLISPITYYLSVLSFIGTFKAFNMLFIMRTPAAQGTLDTAGLVIFDTFRESNRYGEATAQAMLLFAVILTMTLIQRQIFEKRVFYG